jgi:hypothetical protein
VAVVIGLLVVEEEVDSPLQILQLKVVQDLVMLLTMQVQVKEMVIQEEMEVMQNRTVDLVEVVVHHQILETVELEDLV